MAPCNSSPRSTPHTRLSHTNRCVCLQVPLGNLGGESAQVAVADVVLARGLRDAHHLLWVKDAGLPDLGGCWL